MAEEEAVYSTSGSFNNPPPSGDNDVQFGYAKTDKTLSGHFFQTNDTWGNENILRLHCTGSGDEYCADGSRSIHIQGNDWECVMRDKMITIHGSANVIVNGNCNLTVGNPATATEYQSTETERKTPVLSITAHGDVDETIYGTRTTRVTGNYLMDVDGDFDVNCGENHNFRCENYSKKVNGQYKLDCGMAASTQKDNPAAAAAGNATMSFYGKKVTTWYAGQDAQVTSMCSGDWTLQSKNVDIRGGDPTFVSPSGQLGGVNLSSGGDFTISAGLGKAITIENGDLNFVLGNLALELGSISTGFGSISTLTGSVSSAIGSVSAPSVAAGGSLTLADVPVVAGPHSD